MKKIITYGSLRMGHGNHRALLSDSKLLSTEVVNIPFKMISMGGFPGLIPSEKTHDITVEVYEVTDIVYKRVEQLEGYPSFYQKAIISTSLGDYEIYVLEDKRYAKDPVIVEHGDWNKHYSPKYAENF